MFLIKLTIAMTVTITILCSCPEVRTAISPIGRSAQKGLHRRCRRPPQVVATVEFHGRVPSGYVKIAMENGPVEIVSFPMKSMGFFQFVFCTSTRV